MTGHGEGTVSPNVLAAHGRTKDYGRTNATYNVTVALP